jgi:acyl-CoA synthetase (NDP forming)
LTITAAQAHGLFHPPAVTLVGASPRSEVTLHLVHNLRKDECRFPGPLNLINPHPGVIGGIETVSSLEAVAGPLGLVVLLVPPPVCGELLAPLSQLAPTGVVMYAGGREIGYADVEQRFAEWSRSTGIPALGPQSSGLAVPSAGLLPVIAPLIEPVKDGPVGVISQSAGLLGGALKSLLNCGLGFHVGVSCGNSAAVGYQDLAAALFADEGIKVLCMYLDGVPDIAEFGAVLKAWGQADRPVVVAVGGATEAGSVAARSHTGTLSTPRRVLAGVAEQYGAVLVDTVEELVITADTLIRVSCRRPSAPGTIIFTSSGGGGVALADAFASSGVELPPPSPDVAADLAKILSANVDITYNPFDVGGVSLDDAEQFSTCLRLLAEDPAFGIVVESMAAGLPFGGGIDEAHVRHAADFVRLVTAAGKHPVLCAPYEGPVPAAMNWAGVVTTSGARSGATSVRAMQIWSTPPDDGDPGPVPGASPRALAHPGDRDILVGAEAKALLAALPLRWPKQVFLDESDSVDAARDLPYPVVVKTESGIAHRARSGGVLTGIQDAAQLASAVSYLRLRFGGPVSVTEQLPPAEEYIIGYSRQTDGRLLMFGRGGSAVESQATVGARLMLLGRRGAEQLVRKFAIPDAPLVDAILSLQRLVQDADWIQSVDLNPVLVDETGVVALDAKIFTRPSWVSREGSPGSG